MARDGIYLIRKYEVHEPIRKAGKLCDGEARYVDRIPNGKEIAFSNSEGVFLLDITNPKRIKNNENLNFLTLF